MTLFALGFRPLYLLAGAFSALSIFGWSAFFAGWMPVSYLHGSSRWHAHEMIFGYTFAVIVGFLFTAGSNWTRQPTPGGSRLAAICAAWVLARIFALTPMPLVSLAFDVAFTIAAAIGLGIPLWRARNARNYFFVLLILAVGLLNVGFHFALLDRIEVDISRVLEIALDIVLFICVVMAGRVIPMFTNNAVPGANARRAPAVERAALGSILLLLAADVAGLDEGVVAALALVACIANTTRLAMWNPWATRRKPILWILHASYGWIVIHLALRVAAAMEWAPDSLAIHALTVGAIGGLTIGMMTRTSRGHTGRVLETSSAESAAYGLVMAAAAVRVFVPLVPAWTVMAIIVSGLLWAAAFALFTICYWPILSRPRVDGRPG